jgi:hypothetical protein
MYSEISDKNIQDDYTKQNISLLNKFMYEGVTEPICFENKGDNIFEIPRYSDLFEIKFLVVDNCVNLNIDEIIISACNIKISIPYKFINLLYPENIKIIGTKLIIDVAFIHKVFFSSMQFIPLLTYYDQFIISIIGKNIKNLKLYGNMLYLEKSTRKRLINSTYENICYLSFNNSYSFNKKKLVLQIHNYCPNVTVYVQGIILEDIAYVKVQDKTYDNAVFKKLNNGFCFDIRHLDAIYDYTMTIVKKTNSKSMINIYFLIPNKLRYMSGMCGMIFSTSFTQHAIKEKDLEITI